MHIKYGDKLTKATVKIPKDLKHRIVLPKEIWELEKLDYGDFIEIDIQKIKPNPLKRKIFQTIRIQGEKTGLTYLQIREIFPSEHPEDIHDALDELLKEKEKLIEKLIEGSVERYRARSI